MTAPENSQPLTVVVRRRIKPGHGPAFEATMQGFIAFTLSWPGNLGIHVLRPEGSSRDYTVVNRFVDLRARRAFTSSTAYAGWMKQLREFSEDDPHIEQRGGLAGWFTLPEQPALPPPPRWKMAVVTFAAVYPLASAIPPFFALLFPTWPRLLLNIPVNLVVVAALTWVIMPFLTRRLKHWLFLTHA